MFNGAGPAVHRVGYVPASAGAFSLACCKWAAAGRESPGPLPPRGRPPKNAMGAAAGLRINAMTEDFDPTPHVQAYIRACNANDEAEQKRLRAVWAAWQGEDDLHAVVYGGWPEGPDQAGQ